MSVKVSVIVPVYNVETYIHRCIESLINQTLKDIEIILVDDESPDNCGDICDEYAIKDKRIKVIHKKNQGLGLARNSGIEIASGEYIAFVDSDDYVSINMYEKLYSKAKSENADTCYCSYNRVSSNGDIKKHNILLSKELYIHKEVVNNILVNMLGSEPSASEDRLLDMSVWKAIYSRDLLIDNNIRFCSERQFISEDIIFHMDYLLRSKKVTIIKDSLYNYCENSLSLTGLYRADRFEKNEILYFELLKKIQSAKLDTLSKQRVDRSFIGAARLCIGEEVKYSNRNGIYTALKNIKSICNNNIIQDILRYYPISKLPFKHKIFNIFMKYNMPSILFLLVKLKN